MREMRNTYNILVGRPEEKCSKGDLVVVERINNKLDVREIGCGVFY
jgi:hypothetical protein